VQGVGESVGGVVDKTGGAEGRADGETLGKGDTEGLVEGETEGDRVAQASQVCLQFWITPENRQKFFFTTYLHFVVRTLFL